MREFPNAIKKKLPLFIALLFVLTLTGMFFLRSPVLIVTDASFYQLYGSQRFRLAVIRNSLELFRRVIAVPVSENAGPDVIALVVEAALRSPRAVLFPQRYIEGARIFNDRHPEVPVLVMWGRNPLPDIFRQESGIVFVRTDNATDLYRAGLSAAILVNEERDVLFFTDGSLRDQYREAFEDGLLNQGFTNRMVYLDAFMDHVSYIEIGCVIVAGPALRFLERGLDIPVILFSWIDPVQTPRSVRIVFNDSPLALASGALRAFPSAAANEIFVPSRPAVLSARIEERREIRTLRGLIREEFQKN